MQLRETPGRSTELCMGVWIQPILPCWSCPRTVWPWSTFNVPFPTPTSHVSFQQMPALAFQQMSWNRHREVGTPVPVLSQEHFMAHLQHSWAGKEIMLAQRIAVWGNNLFSFFTLRSSFCRIAERPGVLQEGVGGPSWKEGQPFGAAQSCVCGVETGKHLLGGPAD